MASQNPYYHDTHVSSLRDSGIIWGLSGASHVSSLAGLGLHLADVGLFLVQRWVQWTMIILWAIWLSFLFLLPTDSNPARVP